LQGVAITAVKIEGALHEFTSIPNVVEDVTDIVLNLKGVVCRMHSDASEVEAPLVVMGPGDITAKDIDLPAGVEILNPDVHIATLEKKTKLELYMTIGRGRGYRPAEENKSPDQPIGVIPIDSIFSPVKRVAYQVEAARVGQRTDYDKLTLDIETDGSISPQEALASAGDTLRSLVALVADMSDAPQGLELGDVGSATSGSPDLDLPIEELDLSERPRNCLKRAQVNTIGELVERTEDDLLAITNFGQKSLDEVIQKLDERGLSLRVKEG